MRDVADAAGVGLATVSRVVNDAGYVSADSETRVRSAIEQLGFRRDEVARSLRSGSRSSTVGMLVGDLTNPFYGGLVSGVIATLRQHGYAVLIGTADEDLAVERRAVEDLLARRAAGLVIVPDSGDHSFLTDDGGRPRVPAVFVDRPARGVVADQVVVDDEVGGALATRHLLDHGHERIAVLVAPSHHTTGRRLRGYRRAMRTAGIEVDPTLVVRLERGSSDLAAEATTRLMSSAQPPTAVFATTNFLTEGVVRALGRRGQRRVAVVGFDDFPLADLLPTPVTVVRADSAAMGRVSAALLLERMARPTRAAERHVLPVELVPRGSGEIRPG